MHRWVFSGDRINYAPLILAYGNRKRRIHNDSIEQYECNDLLYVNCFGARFVHEPALPSSAWAQTSSLLRADIVVYSSKQ